MPIDQAARDRITHNLSDTLFVEAGAGTGKTSALVDRVVSLVISGVPVREIAAITFAVEAATELRNRIRRRLEHIAAEQAGNSEAAAQALIDLDGAAICTLHAFAQRILVEHPIEAGLPPTVETMDKVSSLVDFQKRWAGVADTLFQDPKHAFTVLAGFALGIKLQHLRDVAQQLDNNWDLIDQRLIATPDPQPINLDPLLTRLKTVVELQQHCNSNTDKMLDRLHRLESFVNELEKAEDDPIAVIQILNDRKDVSSRAKVGNKKNWTGVTSIEEVRNQIWTIDEQIEKTMGQLKDEIIDRLVEIMGKKSVEAAESRRRKGQLSYHDLLVQAHRVLTEPNHGLEVRAALADHYRYFLLDEFQDTDPLQIELAALIADPKTLTSSWRHLSPKPGSLFFVGDPKQSIYGFRRANIALYLDAHETFSGNEVQLEQNFRTTEPILHWINAVFSQLIDQQTQMQPRYTPLIPTRVDLSIGPPVALLGASSTEKRGASELRATSAADVAATVSTALAEGWTVYKSKPTRNKAEPVEDWHPCSPRDIAILVRSRTAVQAIGAALTAANIPHRVEVGFNPLATNEVRDILTTLRTIDDPTDELALATALRSPLFGCSNHHLLEFSLAGGNWNHQDPGAPDLPTDHPVMEAISWIAAMHDQRPWQRATDLIERVVRDRRVMELALCSERPRDAWQQIRTFLNTARTFSETSSSDLRPFLTWCRLHSDQNLKDDEAIPAEPDDNAVRILTMHGAKGLEFPICVLADLGSKRISPGPKVHFPPKGGIAIALTKKLTNAHHRFHADSLLESEHLERLRLLYVATTRARDHLVLSLHRDPSANMPRHPATLTDAEILATASAHIETNVLLKPNVLPLPKLDPPRTNQIPKQGIWQNERNKTLTDGARHRTISATSLVADNLGADESDHSWFREPGRHGTAIGRAVHQALEVTDLKGNGVLDAHMAAANEAVDPDHVASMVSAALAAPSVQAAAENEYWRELYVAVAVTKDVLLEGYLDLAWRCNQNGVEGLAILDYKTDRFTNQSELDDKAARYRHQGAAYAYALQKITSLPVHRVILCFVGGPGGIPAAECQIEDLENGIAEVEDLLGKSD